MDGTDKMDQPFLQLLDFLAVAEFSQAILLIFILLVMDKNRKANIFFAAFLFILSSNFSLIYLVKSEIRTLAIIFSSLSLPGISTAGVFIYFYALFATGLRENFKPRQIFHFSVFLICFVLFVTALYNLEVKPKDSPEFRNAVFIVISTGLINSIGYILYTIIILKKYYNKIENYYSDIERMSLRWLTRITTLTFLTLIFWCIGFWFAYLEIIPRNASVQTAIIIMLIIIIFITAFHIINQPEIFKRNIEMSRDIESNVEDGTAGAEKYAKQSIDDRMQEEYLSKLNLYMTEIKPYLDENITIKDLSEGIDIPSHHLSIVINNRLNKNFYTFINEYRIKEAAAILDDPENSEASIIAIAFRSGFNSKSTFNSVFKKIIGQTPSEYRNRGSSRSELAS